MIARRIHLLAALLAVFVMGLNTAHGREPSRFVEDMRESVQLIAEITVNGTDAAAAYRERQTRFEAEMAAFASNVEARYRNAVQARLVRRINQEIAGSACNAAGTRG